MTLESEPESESESIFILFLFEKEITRTANGKEPCQGGLVQVRLLLRRNVS